MNGLGEDIVGEIGRLARLRLRCSHFSLTWVVSRVGVNAVQSQRGSGMAVVERG